MHVPVASITPFFSLLPDSTVSQGNFWRVGCLLHERIDYILTSLLGFMRNPNTVSFFSSEFGAMLGLFKLTASHKFRSVFLGDFLP